MALPGALDGEVEKLVAALFQLLALVILLFSGAVAAAAEIVISPGDQERMNVSVDGQPFTVHCPSDADRPFFYPVLGPGGEHLTRRWPVEEAAEGEQADHPHHRGLWYTHGMMNGHDFWTEGRGTRIIQQQASVEGGDTLVTENDWVAADGTTVCSDRRSATFSGGEQFRQVDMTITLMASHGRLVIGDTKEGSMAIRLPATMRVSGSVAAGHLLTSEGKRDAEVWGTRADWCASIGPVGEKAFSIVMMDHPSNPRHPTWWHARTYGLLAANAVGRNAYERAPKGSGDLVMESGESVTFRYRILFHEGELDQRMINEHYEEFSHE